MFLRNLHKICSNHSYLLLGIILGIFLNLSITDFDCTNQININEPQKVSVYNYSTIKAILRTNVTRKSTKKPTKLIRPRYYSTELGIKEKLFIGVLTSEEKIISQATHINKTVQHLVDKIKFFITAQPKIKNKLNYTGLVGFTDTRYKFRPFQIIKYIGESFLQDYDYYFLMNDYNYLNARRLKDIASKISVSINVYLGTPVKDSSYCNLDAGILISNSVLRSMKEHLDWCVMNAATDDHSENIGRCIHYATKLDCQEVIQGQSLISYKLKHFVLDKHFEHLIKNDNFNNAVTVYPIIQEKDYYLLHAHFSKKNLIVLKQEIDSLSTKLTESWPPGERKGSTPATRFDLPPQYYFNMTHMYFPDDFTNIRKHKTSDFEDIQMVLNFVKAKVMNENYGKYEYRRLINGYRSFDLSRGLDYKLDIGFRDLHTGKEVIKRFEVCKPLGNVEFIPAPYVTETNRITIILPIQENESDLAEAFIETYSKNIMEHKEKTFLMLVFLYQYNTSSKGKDDVYNAIKEIAVKLSNKYHSEDTKIAWVSIRLPFAEKPITSDEFKVLNFAVVDLALKKIGLESLILVLDVFADVSIDFLNRVRMNTVSNFQVFNPIPFRQYNPRISQADTLEINKNSGHFDHEEYRFISFYAKDYVTARKSSKHIIPLTRIDNDIMDILKDRYRNLGNIFEMFVNYSKNIHCLRATDMSLKVKYHDEADISRNNWFLGTKTQLAQYVLEYANHVGET